MKNESGSRKEIRVLRAFTLFQKIAQTTVCVIWVALGLIMLGGGSGVWRSAFDICSVGLLGISIFNAISMVSFALLERERFSIGRFLIFLAFIVIAVVALALRSFGMDIRLR